jgi:hypothetical protein
MSLAYQYNHSVEATDLGEVVLNPDTYMPSRVIELKVRISGDAQHDGRSWQERDVRCSENELVDVIMQKIRTHVENAVRETKPFSIHGV